MMDKPLNYNRIAPYYDLLAKIASFGQISKAQKASLKSLSEVQSVLVIGGGSGTFLKTLVAINPKIAIDFLDPSEEMLRIARQRLNDTQHNIRFLSDRKALKAQYEACISFFYLDLFSGDTLITAMQELYCKTKTGGLILIADYQPPTNRWMRLYHQLTLGFINLSTGGTTHQFEDYVDLFTANFDVKVTTQQSINRLFFSAVLEKERSS